MNKTDYTVRCLLKQRSFYQHYPKVVAQINDFLSHPQILAVVEKIKKEDVAIEYFRTNPSEALFAYDLICGPNPGETKMTDQLNSDNSPINESAARDARTINTLRTQVLDCRQLVRDWQDRADDMVGKEARRLREYAHELDVIALRGITEDADGTVNDPAISP